MDEGAVKMTGKLQLKAVEIPAMKEGQSRWVKVCTGAHLVQVPKDVDVNYAFADKEEDLANITEDDCFRFRQELDDNYVNQPFDTIWVLKDPHQTYTISIAKFGTA